MLDEVLNIIRAHPDLLEQSKFDQLYQITPPDQRTTLTSLLQTSDIDHLHLMTRVPARYAEALPMASIDIPAGVEVIEEGAFRECTALKSATLPNTLKKIERGAFMYCTYLPTIKIPEGVEKIPMQCFAGCYRLATIELPTTLQFILIEAFWRCYSLYDVVYAGTMAQWKQVKLGQGALPYGCEIHCSDGVLTFDGVTSY